MAFPSKTTVQGIDEEPTKDSPSDKKSDRYSGPPPQTPKPKAASNSSLFSVAGQAAQDAGKSGLGAEGSDTSMVGMQGLTLVQRGLQMLNLAFPDNPGLLAVLADLTGRLQAIIPQLVADAQNGGAGMGMMGAMMQPQGGPPMPGMQPNMPSPVGGGMPPPPGMMAAGQVPPPPPMR
jgi:hypothetical protein